MELQTIRRSSKVTNNRAVATRRESATEVLPVVLVLRVVALLFFGPNRNQCPALCPATIAQRKGANTTP
jgi:hypothetical protein